MNDRIGIVIIGRNEGERLVRCLASVRGQSPVIYVDSGSKDNSLAAAKSAQAIVVELDMSIPFSAARARNEGFSQLLKLDPGVSFVQFIDGDCEMVQGWFEKAAHELKVNSEVAAVCGRLRERFPDHSVYNRLCDIEWDKPVGLVDACGGIAMYRTEYFQTVGGFDSSVVAGEEPELCQRLRSKGWQIKRLPEEMAWHDSAMYRFSQWWKRQVRGGYGAMDVALRFEQGRQGNFSRQIRRARMWIFGYPLAIVWAAVVGFFWGRWKGAAIGAVAIICVLPLQILRLAWQQRRGGSTNLVALAFGWTTMAAKMAHVVGHAKYRRDRRRRQDLQVIEYKSAPTPSPARNL